MGGGGLTTIQSVKDLVYNHKEVSVMQYKQSLTQ